MNLGGGPKASIIYAINPSCISFKLYVDHLLGKCLKCTTAPLVDENTQLTNTLMTDSAETVIPSSGGSEERRKKRGVRDGVLSSRMNHTPNR